MTPLFVGPARLPAMFLHEGPLGLTVLQWLLVPGLISASAVGGILLGQVVRAILVRVTARTRSAHDDVIVTRLRGPIAVGCGLFVAWAGLPSLGLPPEIHGRVVQGLRAFALMLFFWALLRSVDVAADVIRASPWGAVRAASRSLVPLGARLAKVALVAIAVVAMLSELGYPIASLVAGLGVGGLAVALASQKTFENLFGAFSIGADEPFREGDFVKVEDFVGTVEALGLRSTRFRTLDRTIISIPNGKLADMRLESFSARDRMRLACILGVEYRTTAAQMRQVLEGLEGVLRAHQKIWPDAVVVRFQQFGASSLDIEVMAWFQTSDWSEFQLIRQEVLLSFMEVVERAGTSFAFPTQTLHVASLPAEPGVDPAARGL